MERQGGLGLGAGRAATAALASGRGAGKRRAGLTTGPGRPPGRSALIGLALTAAQQVRVMWQRVSPFRSVGVTGIVGGVDGVWLVRHTYQPGWYMPGGSVKRGETFEAAVIRELREEIGIRVACRPRLVSVHHVRPNGYIALFAIDAWEGEPTPSSIEIREVRLADPAAPFEGVSTATRRRMAELLGEREPDGRW